MATAKTLRINGTTYPIPAGPDRMLLGVLRDELDLTGTKYGCGEGQCGACTVLIDGVPRRSCITPLRAVQDQEITTIEGVAKDGALHPLQASFLEVGAMQCGYCTSGMILSGVGLLQKNSNPSTEEILDFMQGNICRCGTYVRILDAIHKASAVLREGKS